MKKHRWQATGFALALAGIMIFADLSWAQGRGGGGGPYCPAYQTSQAGGGGLGPGYQNCPNYPGYTKSGQGWSSYSQGRRGPRRGLRANPPNSSNPQTNPPEVTGN